MPKQGVAVKCISYINTGGLNSRVLNATAKNGVGLSRSIYIITSIKCPFTQVFEPNEETWPFSDLFDILIYPTQ